MQIIQFNQEPGCGSALKTGNPVIFQNTENLVDGQGAVPVSIVSLPDGAEALYGGTFTNEGCYDAKLDISYLVGNDCDKCTEDSLTIAEHSLVIPKDAVATIPDGFWFRMDVTLLDKNGQPVNLTGSLTQSVGVHSSYTPDCPADAVMVPSAQSVFLQKSASIIGAGAVGDIVRFRFIVTNTGLSDLINVSISDSLLPVPGTLALLPSGAKDQTTFTADYTITAADVIAQSIVNTATVNAASTNGNPVSAQATVTVNVRDQVRPTPVVIIDPVHDGSGLVNVTINWDEDVLACGPEICNITGGVVVP